MVVRRPAPTKSTLFVVAVLATVGTLLLASGAAADPLQSKRAQADAVMAQIQSLDASVGKAVEEYNAAEIRLDEIRAKQRENQRHLVIAKASFGKAQSTLQKRLLTLYTSGESSTIEILLGASSLDDLLARADAVSRVSKQDARIIREIRAYRAEVKKREAELRKARSDQEAVVADLAAQRREIESQLAQRRQLLSSIKSEISRIQAEEAARARRLAAQTERRIASNPSSFETTGGGGGGGGGGGAGGGGRPAASEPPPYSDDEEPF